VFGRDRNFRPLFVNRPAVLLTLEPNPTPEEIITASTFITEYVRNNFLIPGQVENWSMLIDLEGLGLLNVPFKQIKAFLKAM